MHKNYTVKQGFVTSEAKGAHARPPIPHNDGANNDVKTNSDDDNVIGENVDEVETLNCLKASD